MRRLLLLAGIIAIIAAAALAWRGAHEPQSGSRTTRIALGDTTIVADIADTETSREQGLSGRQQLDDSLGMLFVFENSGYWAFWMKDMRFSLDMIWLDADKKVVYIAPDASPSSYPASFTPNSPALYVIEVSAGWAARHHVSAGSRASWQ